MTSSRLLLDRMLRAVLLAGSLAGGAVASAAEPALFAHYMPWYEAKPTSPRWGSHWTMGRFDPDQARWDGVPQLAAHDAPLIGPYDSGDDHAMECQVLLMKIAGIRGLIIDWYGMGDRFDHPMIHRNVQKLIPWLDRAGLEFAICYEDRSTASLPEGKEREQARADLDFLESHWFPARNYARLEGRPLLLVFGPQHLVGGFETSSKPIVFGLPHLAKERGCEGIFAWPPVTGGKTLAEPAWRRELESIYKRPAPKIAVAFPGFHDIYAQAGVRASYGRIESGNGRTLAASLEQAIASGAPIVQLATWNDYGEGTMIEPTRGRGYRSLEQIQRAVGKGNPADLRLPVVLYQFRKRGGDAAALDRAAAALFRGESVAAEALLAAVGRDLAKQPLDANYRLHSELLYREEPGITPAMNQRCRLDVYAPAEKKAFSTVIWFHGGGLTQGERSIPPALRNRGIAVVAANYRLGPEAKAVDAIDDAAAAVAWTLEHIDDFGGDPDRVFVSGHSAGAYLALMVGLDERRLAARGASADRIAGLIPLSPQVITHFAVRNERGLPETRPLIDEFAPLYHIRKTAPPILLVTGDREMEMLGRYEENAYFARMMKIVGHTETTLRELDGFGHGNMPEPAFPLLLEFVSRKSKRDSR